MTHIFAGVTLFCDDIREEHSGINTLVGIYPDNVVVEAIPFAFSKLALYTRLTVPGDFEVEPINVSLFVGGEERPLASITAELVEKAIQDAKRDGAQIGGMISRAVYAPFPVLVPTRMRVVAKSTTYQLEMATLSVREGTRPTTTSHESPPSEQSPPPSRKKRKRL